MIIEGLDKGINSYSSLSSDTLKCLLDDSRLQRRKNVTAAGTLSEFLKKTHASFWCVQKHLKRGGAASQLF